MRSRATSSAANAFPGLNGLAIIGCTRVEIDRLVDLVDRVDAWRRTADTGRSLMPFDRYHAYVTSSGAKMPFSASASAIMLAIVLR